MNIKATALIMPSESSTRSGKTRIETHGYYISKPHSFNSRLDQPVKNPVIVLQDGHNLPSYSPFCLMLVIVVSVLALFTAEFLVRPPITDLFSAFQTIRNIPDYVLAVIHPS